MNKCIEDRISRHITSYIVEVLDPITWAFNADELTDILQKAYDDAVMQIVSPLIGEDLE